MEIGISLGSNLGDRLACLRTARERIGHLSGVTITACSCVYETEPVDVPAVYGRMSFLNAVVVVETNVDLASLLEMFRDIEEDMGRRRGPDRNAPRPIDIDIIFAGTSVVKEEGLVVPHPRWAERKFVVAPLADVRPHLVLPGQDRSVKEILSTLPEHPAVVLFSKEW